MTHTSRSNDMIKIFTIGFTRKSAESFFTKLAEAGVRRVVDTRLNNMSQLAGFAKRDDLKFFLDKISNIPFTHQLELAPTEEMLKRYKNETHDWSTYEGEFLNLIKKRHIETLLKPEELNHACLLCSEEMPHRCHRRLVAEYLREKWTNVEIIHLV